MEGQTLVKNYCGHMYCTECMKAHLLEKLKAFNKDPFPPCIND